MTIDPGATLALIRERKPLVHNITNYVVMNETANAVLALGALPVMAHAREEVAEMVGLAGALVLNIGTLSETWVDAMLIAGKAANERGIPVVLDPVGAGATAYRTETAQRLLDEIDVTVLRGNAGEVATLVGFEAEVRGVESVGVGGDPAELTRVAANALGVVVSVTGPVDHVSDGDRRASVANGHPLLASITGTGCMSTAITGCFLAGKDDAFEAAVEALVAFGVAGEDAAAEAKGPGSFHVGLYDALAGLDPATLTERAKIVVRLHALVSDEATARRAAAGGATVVQLRLKGAPTAEVVALGRALEGLEADLIVNDDVDAAIELGTGVHLGQGDPGVERAREAGIPFGISVTTRREGAVAEFAGATYVGAGPVWRDAVEARCSRADRDRRTARHLPLGRHPRRRDRRRRRVERGRVHPRGRGRGGGDPGRRGDRVAARGRR